MTQYEVCATSCSDSYDVMESRLMQMTYWAHKAVLFEKIKQKIEEQEGKKLEKIAELLVEASRNRLQNNKEASRRRDTLEEQLREVLDE